VVVIVVVAARVFEDFDGCSHE